MANKIVGIDDFEKELAEMLGEYADDVIANSDEEIERIVKLIIEELIKTSKRSSKLYIKYADGWTYKKEKYMGGIIYTIHNKYKPTLTHLLEFGWLGELVEVQGDFRISKAFEKYKETLLDQLYAELNK